MVNSVKDELKFIVTFQFPLSSNIIACLVFEKSGLLLVFSHVPVVASISQTLQQTYFVLLVTANYFPSEESVPF